MSIPIILLTAPSPPFSYPVSWGPDMPPDHQAVWAVKVALAYFLIGLGSMIIVISAINDIKIPLPAVGGSVDSISRTAKFKLSIGITSLVAIILGLVFLVLDAGKPYTAWEIITYGLTYGRWESWMFLGTIFLIMILLLGLIYSALWLGNAMPNITMFKKLGSWYTSSNLSSRTSRYLLISLITVFGILGASYGGVLFSLTNIALWRNPVLVILFPVSGLSSAAAVGMLLTTVFIKDESSKEHNTLLWSTIDLYSVIAEAILTAMFLAIGVYNPNASMSVNQVLFGAYSLYFWVLVVTLGVAIPMLLEISLHKISPKKYIYIVPIITILILIGAVSLRYYVVIASAYYYGPISPFSPTQMQFPWGTVWGE